MPPAQPGFDAVRPREETTRGTFVVADASGEEDEAPQHFGTVEVSPPPGGKKPKCRKNNAPGSSNVVLSTRLIGGVGRRKPLNHHSRPAASRNEVRSWRSDDSERVDMEPSQKIATSVSKGAAVHSENFHSISSYASKADENLHWKNTGGDRLLSERRLTSSKSVLGDRLRHFMTLAEPTVSGKDHSTSNYAVSEQRPFPGVWIGVYTCRITALVGIFDSVTPQAVRCIQDEVCTKFAKSESLREEFQLVVQAVGLVATRTWLFQSRPPYASQDMSVIVEPGERLRESIIFWAEFLASKNRDLGPRGVSHREEKGTEWAQFLAVHVGIWRRGELHLHFRVNGTQGYQNGRPKVLNDKPRSSLGSGRGTRARIGNWKRWRGGRSILPSWMHRTAMLFLLLLLVVCGLTSVDALEEITNGNIKTAARNWKDNNPSADAIARYGRIEDWDVSRVTDMNRSKLSFLYCVVYINIQV